MKDCSLHTGHCARHDARLQVGAGRTRMYAILGIQRMEGLWPCVHSASIPSALWPVSPRLLRESASGIAHLLADCCCGLGPGPDCRCAASPGLPGLQRPICSGPSAGWQQGRHIPVPAAPVHASFISPPCMSHSPRQCWMKRMHLGSAFTDACPGMRLHALGIAAGQLSTPAWWGSRGIGLGAP